MWAPSEKALIIVKSLIVGNPENARYSIVDIQNHILLIIKSPLAASLVVECILELRDACFNDLKMDSIGFFVGFIFVLFILFILFCFFLVSSVMFADLRLEKAACDIESRWCQEPSIAQAKRALNALFSNFLEFFRVIFLVSNVFLFFLEKIRPIVRQESEADDNLDLNKNYSKPLPSSCFAFCFPLIKTILLNRADYIKQDDAFLTELIEFCCVHVSRASANSENVNFLTLRNFQAFLN